MLTPSTGVPLASVALALNIWVPPTSMEKLELGLSVTVFTAPPLGLGLLLPRQPVRATTKVTIKVRRKPEPQRCMNPPRVRLPGASIIIMLLGGKLSV